MPSTGTRKKKSTAGRKTTRKKTPSAKKRQIIKELRQMCTEELPEYVQPVGYKFLDAMPMTPVGKFDYRKLETEITSRDY